MILHKKILFDMDGVIADFIASYTKLANKLFGLDQFGELTRPSKKWRMTDSGYVTKEQDDAIWAVIKNPDSHFWFDIPPLVGKETLQKIDRLCFENDVYFITNRYGAAAKRDTERWLKWHGIGLPTVVVTGTSLSGAE